MTDPDPRSPKTLGSGSTTLLVTSTIQLGKYARTFGCNMTEAEEENLENYTNLGEFFRRKLKVTFK
jgi:phosphatidylserine decarboxylase